jgi:hypothetical protein
MAEVAPVSAQVTSWSRSGGAKPVPVLRVTQRRLLYLDEHSQALERAVQRVDAARFDGS